MFVTKGFNIYIIVLWVALFYYLSKAYFIILLKYKNKAKFYTTSFVKKIMLHTFSQQIKINNEWNPTGTEIFL
jgi:hypothetical protein